MQEMSLTIAIPAYNEANNIRYLLESVLKQNLDGFILSQILVINDNSADNTFQEALSVPDVRISVISDGRRVGKNARMNEIFSQVRSDILIQLDADIVLNDENTLANLLAPYLGPAPLPVLVCGDHAPLLPRTWAEQIAHFGEMVWLSSIHLAGDHACAFRCYGHIRAFTRTFYKAFTVPQGLQVNEDLYSFLWATERKLPVAFAPTAVVQYRLPNNLSDYVKQFRRTHSYQKQTLQGVQKTVLPSIPRWIMLKQLLRRMLRTRPDIVFGFFIVRLFCLFGGGQETQTNVWEVSNSTKRIN